MAMYIKSHMAQSKPAVLPILQATAERDNVPTAADYFRCDKAQMPRVALFFSYQMNFVMDVCPG